MKHEHQVTNTRNYLTSDAEATYTCTTATFPSAD